MLRNLILAVVTFLFVGVFAADQTLTWEVALYRFHADSTVAKVGTFLIYNSAREEDAKNPKRQFANYINAYKSSTGDSDLDSLMFYNITMTFDPTLTLCADVDSLDCASFDWKALLGGVQYVPIDLGM